MDFLLWMIIKILFYSGSLYSLLPVELVGFWLNLGKSFLEAALGLALALEMEISFELFVAPYLTQLFDTHVEFMYQILGIYDNIKDILIDIIIRIFREFF